MEVLGDTWTLLDYGEQLPAPDSLWQHWGWELAGEERRQCLPKHVAAALLLADRGSPATREEVVGRGVELRFQVAEELGGLLEVVALAIEGERYDRHAPHHRLVQLQQHKGAREHAARLQQQQRV